MLCLYFLRARLPRVLINAQQRCVFSVLKFREKLFLNNNMKVLSCDSLIRTQKYGRTM